MSAGHRCPFYCLCPGQGEAGEALLTGPTHPAPADCTHMGTHLVTHTFTLTLLPALVTHTDTARRGLQHAQVPSHRHTVAHGPLGWLGDQHGDSLGPGQACTTLNSEPSQTSPTCPEVPHTSQSPLTPRKLTIISQGHLPCALGTIQSPGSATAPITATSGVGGLRTPSPSSPTTLFYLHSLPASQSEKGRARLSIFVSQKGGAGLSIPIL